jgi:uncharacterized RDD family membrane protein YckC
MLAAPAPTDDFRYPGNRLGLPEDGSGSVAGWGRRLAALFVDWIVAGLIASALVRRPLWAGGNDLDTAQLLAFCLTSTVLVGMLGATIGHRMLGLRVTRLDGRPVGLLRALVRSVLICLVIPPVVYDRDRRGLHDKAAATVVVRR